MQFQSLPSQVAAHLEEEIRRGRWSEFLPGERSLASSLGVSRRTLTAALGRLQGAGVIRAEPARGKSDAGGEIRHARTLGQLGPRPFAQRCEIDPGIAGETTGCGQQATLGEDDGEQPDAHGTLGALQPVDAAFQPVGGISVRHAEAPLLVGQRCERTVAVALDPEVLDGCPHTAAAGLAPEFSMRPDQHALSAGQRDGLRQLRELDGHVPVMNEEKIMVRPFRRTDADAVTELAIAASNEVRHGMTVGKINNMIRQVNRSDWIGQAIRSLSSP